MTRGTFIELDLRGFRQTVEREFSYLTSDYGFPPPLFWEFADMLFASFEHGDVRVEMWCGKREAEVWSVVERLAVGRSIGLDSLHASRSDEPAYPPSMGDAWVDGEPDRKIRLEATILKQHLDVINDREPTLFESLGGPLQPEAVALDDPVGTFARRCLERFRFLEQELGLEPELVDFGSGVLYRGAHTALRIRLLQTCYEHEDEGDETLYAELITLIDGKLPPPYAEPVELDIGDRSGPFSAAYLEDAFSAAERQIRAHASALRNGGTRNG
jgi:hypothetical protein